MEIGQALREARQAAGWRQGALARQIGVSIWTLNRVEHGARRFDLGWLVMLPAAIRGPVAAAVELECQRRIESDQLQLDVVRRISTSRVTRRKTVTIVRTGTLI